MRGVHLDTEGWHRPPHRRGAVAGNRNRHLRPTCDGYFCSSYTVELAATGGGSRSRSLDDVHDDSLGHYKINFLTSCACYSVQREFILACTALRSPRTISVPKSLVISSSS